MQDRLKEIQDRLNGYSVVLKKDMMFLLAALQEAQTENKRLEGRNNYLQAENNQLSDNTAKYGQEADELEIKLQQAEAREQGLRESLEFYADDTNWQSHFGCISEAGNDEGVIAREALKQEDKP